MTPALSNSLTDLSHRIKVEHQAVSASLKESIRHAIAAGEMLIEAKAQLKHGQWLPWLREHCTISERTAQLYMRCAKSRKEIEEQIRNGVADLSLNEAAAILAMSSDMKKLLDFASRAADMGSEELIEYAAKNDIGVITKHPFGQKYGHELDDHEKLEWEIFQLHLLKQGVCAEEASYIVDRLQSRGWHVTMDCREDEQYYGDWGDTWRKRQGMREISQNTKDRWFAFYNANRDRPLADVEAEIQMLAARAA